MQRRQVIKGVAASGLVSVGAGVAAGQHTTPGGATGAADLDYVQVARDGAVVRTVADPSEADLDRLFARLGDDESLVTPQECCYYECQSECAYCDYPPGCTDDCCCDYRDGSC